MSGRRLKPLIWPVTVLVMGGLTALLAQAAAWSAGTLFLYGMTRLVSDLLLIIGIVWLAVALFRVVRPARR